MDLGVPNMENGIGERYQADECQAGAIDTNKNRHGRLSFEGYREF